MYVAGFYCMGELSSAERPASFAEFSYHGLAVGGLVIDVQNALSFTSECRVLPHNLSYPVGELSFQCVYVDGANHERDKKGSHGLYPQEPDLSITFF